MARGLWEACGRRAEGVGGGERREVTEHKKSVLIFSTTFM